MAVLTGVPRVTIPATQARRRARVVLAGVFLGPVLALVALAVAAGHRSAPAVGPVPAHDRAFARVAAEDFLAGRATSLPYAAGLDPSLGRSGDGASAPPIAYRSLAWQSAAEEELAGRRYEDDTFLVATGAGLWHLSVQTVDSPGGPVIGADPSLAPAPMAPTDQAAAVSVSALAGDNQSELGDGANRQIQAWAQAYANGDSATLYRLTGDTRPETYASLQGWVFDRVSVTSSATSGNRALAQLQLTMHQVDQPASAMTSSYDVLLGDLNQSLPFVQAWGPPGSGPALVAYQNGLPTAPSTTP